MKRDITTIARCVRRVIAAKDGRGTHQAQRLAADELGGTAIDRNAAAAARVLGEFIKTWGKTT